MIQEWLGLNTEIYNWDYSDVPRSGCRFNIEIYDSDFTYVTQD